MSSSQYIPKVAGVTASFGLVFAVFVLAFSATTIDTVRKLKNKESVPQSNITTAYVFNSALIIGSVIAGLVFGYSIYSIYKNKQ
jgi:hypothetical protein